MKLYLETSVPNFLFHDDAPEKQEITKRFFRWLQHTDDALFTSVIVEAELRRTSGAAHRERLLKALESLPLTTLDLTPDAITLAEAYVRDGIIPRRYLNDALQAAIAVCHHLDIVVSWNIKHLVNVRKVDAMNRINRERHLPFIRIHTPEEVMPQ
jgi:predicted nucleic acid-binding protein